MYVDGFNFYYGVVRNTTFKWLDLEKLFARLLPDFEVERILYFTARVKPTPWDKTAHLRQDKYLRALRMLPSVEIVQGTYSRTFPPLHLLNPRNVSQTEASDWAYPTVFVWKNEEKGSDVSLGARLVYDGCTGAYDVAVVVSNDSDLLEPIRLVTQKVGLPVHAVLPANERTKAHRPRSVFEGHATSIIATSISWNTLRKCQLPSVLGTDSAEVHKPTEWD
ncbi:MAG: NYN domain-containing protein [Coriobacteriia bacterium]